MSDFAARARAALEEHGLSVRAAAKNMAFDPGHLSRVLSGKRPPSSQLAEALDRLVGAEGALSALAATLTPDDRERVADSIAVPSRMDAGTVESLAAVLAAQRRLEDAIGPAAMLPATRAQLDTVRALAREARGPHHMSLLAVAAEWSQYVGWLLAAVRRDQEAVTMLTRAEEMADEAETPTVGAVAVSFRGYVARQQERPLGVVRAAQAALHTPGVHIAQQVFDTLQAAQGYAALGAAVKARRLLDDAAHRSTEVGEAPGIVYWYTPPFFRLNIGLAQLSLGDHTDAADHLTAGLNGLPPDQQDAEWTQEYRDALENAHAA